MRITGFISITNQPWYVTQTTIAVTKPVKERIKKLQRQIAVERDDKVNQNDVIEYLLDNMEDT